MKLGLEGIITLTTRNADDEITGQVVVHNDILDSGLDMLATSVGGPFDYCRIGTGTTPVAPSQTGLQSPAASTAALAPGGNTDHAMTATSPRYNRTVFRRRFAAGTLNGTYNEIGFGPASTGNLFNRALITPSKTVLSTETLDVEYELRTYIPTADVTGTATIGGVSRSFTLRPVDINETSVGFGEFPWGVNRYGNALSNPGNARAYTGGALAAQTADSPTFTAQESAPTTVTLPDAYVPGTGYRKVRFAWGLDALNVVGGSFTHMRVGVICAKWQIEFSPAIAKDATKTMSIDLGVTFARYP